MNYVGLATKITVILLFLLQFSLALNDQNTGYNYEEELLYDTFPDNFMWGTATAAYQVTYVNFELSVLFPNYAVVYRCSVDYFLLACFSAI